MPAFNLLIPDPTVLGATSWPAPSCLVWAGVSKAFAGGIGALAGRAARRSVIGAVLGVALALLEQVRAEEAASRSCPSPSGLGIAMVIPASNAIAMFVGAAIAHVLRKTKPALGERWTVPVSSGLIAGESLMGILIKLLVVAGVLQK